MDLHNWTVVLQMITYCVHNSCQSSPSDSGMRSRRRGPGRSRRWCRGSRYTRLSPADSGRHSSPGDTGTGNCWRHPGMYQRAGRGWTNTHWCLNDEKITEMLKSFLTCLSFELILKFFQSKKSFGPTLFDITELTTLCSGTGQANAWRSRIVTIHHTSRSMSSWYMYGTRSNCQIMFMHAKYFQYKK